ncbi:MAG: hypothetical protein AAF530_14095 [Pseudomonadota bacterium]
MRKLALWAIAIFIGLPQASVAADRTIDYSHRGMFGNPAISANGRFVAVIPFRTQCDDTFGEQCLLVLDRKKDSIKNIVDTDFVDPLNRGIQGEGSNFTASLSADGRYIAFDSTAPDLVKKDSNGWSDVFVFDQKTGDTSRVSVSNSGRQGNDFSGSPKISATGRYVFFTSRASNLVKRDTNLAVDLFVRDRVKETTERVLSDIRSTIDYEISADGRFLVYSENIGDVWLLDRRTGKETELTADLANRRNEAPSISQNGRFIVFSSGSSSGIRLQSYRYDQKKNQFLQASKSNSGLAADRATQDNLVSNNGRYIFFSTFADNLFPGDDSTSRDIFVHDVRRRTTDMLSKDTDSIRFMSANRPAVSADGNVIVWNATASPSNGFTRIFVHDRGLRPAAPDTLAPSKATKDRTPKFRWEAIAGSDKYHVEVIDSKGRKINYKNVTPRQAKCTSGVGMCSRAWAREVLPKGRTAWRIRSYNISGWSKWSKRQRFTIQ